MAPRRQRKVGLMRMDAAIDALRIMGFSPDLTRRKVKELLKVYGDEGWTFIEEGSYRLLIEYIMDDGNDGQGVEGEPSTQIELRDEDTQEYDPLQAEQDALLLSNREDGLSQPEPLSESTKQDALLLSNREDGPSQPEPMSESTKQDALLLSPVTVLNPVLPHGKSTVSPGENDASDPDLPVGKPTVSPSKKDASKPDLLFGRSTVSLSKNDISDERAMPENGIYDFCLPQVDHLLKVRKHHFGWIGQKDEEDYVLLKPFPVQGWKPSEWRRKRKSRWDVGPHDTI